jgi:hypothetical protein
LFKITHNTQFTGNVGNYLPAKHPYVAQENQVDRQVTPYWSKYHGYPGSNTNAAEPSDRASLWDGHIPHPRDRKVGK